MEKMGHLTRFIQLQKQCKCSHVTATYVPWATVLANAKSCSNSCFVVGQACWQFKILLIIVLA